jgi:hypothetical protein
VARATYKLYVDESGSFSLPDQPSIVCGVLEDVSAGVDWEAVRRELARAVPLMEYPQHAAHLNTPSAWLAAVMRKPELARDATPWECGLRRICGPIVGAIHGVPAGRLRALDELRAAVSEGRLPPVATLLLVDAWLRDRDPQGFRALSAAAAQLRFQLQDTFRRLFHRYRYGELFGVAALALPACPRDEDAYSGASLGAVRLDTYTRALETLFERVLCLLRGGPSGGRVDLWVATRYVELRGFGTMELSRDAVQQIAARAQRFPELREASEVSSKPRPEVTLAAARGIVRFDASAPMGLVMADFLSNRLHHLLRGHAACSLEEACERIQTTLSLPLLAVPSAATATTPLPTLGADGPARARIRDAFAGLASAGPVLSPRWNREQAEHWVRFASGEASEP